MLADLAFQSAVDWLSPQEYDGKALLDRSIVGDPRLRPSALLSWELNNLAAALSHIRSFFVTTASRDKFARFVQYACRLWIGILSLSRSRQDARSHPLVQQLWQVLSTISNARRTFRFLEFGPLIAFAHRAVGAAGPTGALWAAAWTSQATSALFSILDRVRWLQDHAILKGDPRATSQRAMRLLCVGHAAQAFRLLWRAASLRIAAAPRAEILICLRDALKQLLCLMQAAHIGKIPRLQSHDVAVGLAGILTAGDDVRLLWLKQGAHSQSK
jgi:hypothetical protein